MTKEVTKVEINLFGEVVEIYVESNILNGLSVEEKDNLIKKNIEIAFLSKTENVEISEISTI